MYLCMCSTCLFFCRMIELSCFFFVVMFCSFRIPSNPDLASRGPGDEKSYINLSKKTEIPVVGSTNNYNINLHVMVCVWIIMFV